MGSLGRPGGCSRAIPGDGIHTFGHCLDLLQIGCVDLDVLMGGTVEFVDVGKPESMVSFERPDDVRS